MRKKKLAVSLIAIFLVSCGARSQETGNLRLLQAELEHVRAERDKLWAQVESMADAYDEEQRRWIDRTSELSAELRKLKNIQREKTMLEGRYSGLQNRYRQLERWASDLAEGYGPGIWIYSDDHQWPLYGRKPRDASVRGIVAELNDYHRNFDNPLLVLKGIEDAVVKLGVSDAVKLTDGMGSSGAISYIQTAVYSLASLPDIDCVQFEFEEGSHAAPGKYCN